MRAWLKLFVKIFDWLSWFPCTWTMRDHHRPLSWCKHVVIWPLTWLVELWKVPRKTPLLAYINQELTTIKRNCLDRIPFASDCLSLARGAGLADSRLTFSRDPSALLREVPLPLSFCRAPPSVRHKNSQILYSIILSFSQCWKDIIYYVPSVALRVTT